MPSSSQPSSASAPLTVVVAGGSGFLGTHLRAALADHGHTVVSLVRREPQGAGEARWDPDHGSVPTDVVASADVVVNLAGSPTLGNPHSSTWAQQLHDTRVRTTELLAEAIATAGEKPPAYLAGNGISYYGDHGDAELTEASDTRGHSLLTQVARDWQTATGAAERAGARVCVLRTAPVMDRRSAPLQQLALLFKSGLGGRLGNGRQYMPMISLRDWVAGVVHLAEHDTVSGAVNLTMPTPATNREFTKALAHAVRRPAVAAVPAPLLRAAAGKMAPELLGSVRVLPASLTASGFTFADPDVDAVLATGLAKR